MIKLQILEAIKQMPNVERLEIIEFALRLVREEMEKTTKLSLYVSGAICFSTKANQAGGNSR